MASLPCPFRAFQELLSDHSEGGLEEYNRSCGAITMRFAEHSHRIRAIEGRLLGDFPGNKAALSISKAIRNVQLMEKEKLQLVTN